MINLPPPLSPWSPCSSHVPPHPYHFHPKNWLLSVRFLAIDAADHVTSKEEREGRNVFRLPPCYTFTPINNQIVDGVQCPISIHRIGGGGVVYKFSFFSPSLLQFTASSSGSLELKIAVLRPWTLFPGPLTGLSKLFVCHQYSSLSPSSDSFSLLLWWHFSAGGKRDLLVIYLFYSTQFFTY